MHTEATRASAPSRGQLTIRVSILVLSFLGYLDALYLSLAHFRNVTVNCSVTHGCEQVLHSRYSSVLGIPVATLGVAFYVVAFYLTVATITNPVNLCCRLLKLLACLGLLASVLLFVTQAVVIQAYCQYCIASSIASVGIFLLSLGVRGKPDTTRIWW